jgi:hypothetical protein
MTMHKEKRGQTRKKVNLPVSYVFCDERNIAPHDGTTFDLCNSGMSFYTNTPLKEGLNVQVHTYIWDSPKTSIVRWRSKKSRNIYKIGVSFQ